MLDQLPQPLARGDWQRTQRVAVQVDDVLREGKQPPELAQRVACVKRGCLLTVEYASFRDHASLGVHQPSADRRGYATAGSVRTFTTAGRPQENARSRAGPSSSGEETSSPWHPRASATRSYRVP